MNFVKYLIDMRSFIPWLMCLSASVVVAAEKPATAGRRLEVLFFGAPTASHPGHDPITRYRVIKRNLGTEGINFTYSENPTEVFNAQTLKHYDALMMYGNWEQKGVMPAAQLKTLIDYVESGHGFLPIHCASACYGGSPEFVRLVGGRFQSHETGEFEPQTINSSHPITQGLAPLRAWDETYVHDQQGQDRTILQVRDKEPWTWVREQGKGRVFYTASGHDHRVWDRSEFHALLKNAIYWSVGTAAYQQLQALALPKLEMEPMELPGYKERRLITEGQKPLSPQDSLKMAQVPPGFELSLFASEPDIVNPISITWDNRGRAYVLQSVDYPNNLHENRMGNDKITLCEDTDHDGRADKFTLFADHLSIPSSVCYVNGGLLCTNASEILFLKDTNGDDKADVRQTVISGFGVFDTHAGVSNLHYGMDQWVYATVGYSGFDGTVGGENWKFSSGVFRFRADGSKLEFLQSTTNNTWGLGFTADFDVLGSTANGNPSWYHSLSRERYAMFALDQPKTPRTDDNPIFNPSSNDIRQVDQFERYTAGAGHAFYNADRFSKEYQNRIAFVCEPTGKLVGQFEFEPSGAGFVSKQSPNNFYNSADAWSGPVAAEVGPDGAVWICDWYNLIIQHNPTPRKDNAGMDAKNGKGNAYETPVRDTKLGRVYRVFPKGSKNDSMPVFDAKKPASYLAGLSHPNMLWRNCAQTELLNSGAKGLAPQLKDLVKQGGVGAGHAFGALVAWDLVDDATLLAALQGKSVAAKRLALTQTAKLATHTSIVVDLFDAAAKKKDALAMKDALVAFSYLPENVGIAKALAAAVKNKDLRLLEDPVLADAWQIAARQQQKGVLAQFEHDDATNATPAPAKNMLANADFTAVSEGLPQGWKLHVYGGDAKAVSMSADATGGRNGSAALKITSSAAVDAGAGYEVAVQKNTRYRFSAWIKTDNVVKSGGQGAMLNAHGFDEKSVSIDGTKDWTAVSFEFESADNDHVLLHCLFGGYGGATGTAWWDDVSLVPLGSKSDYVSAVEKLRQYQPQKGDNSARVIKRFEASLELKQRAELVYNRTCAACHQPDGKGTPGVFPPLDGSEWLVNDVGVPIKVVLKGLQGPVTVKGATYVSAMPAHVDLSDQEIADVLTYVRQSWSNDAPPVKPEQVKGFRASLKARTAPFTAQELGK